MGLSLRLAIPTILGGVAVVTVAHASISGSNDWCDHQTGGFHCACDYETHEKCEEALKSLTKGTCHHKSKTK